MLLLYIKDIITDEFEMVHIMIKNDKIIAWLDVYGRLLSFERPGLDDGTISRIKLV